jgi:Secretion system C-terminal sorting domain/Carboxylesterase family
MKKLLVPFFFCIALLAGHAQTRYLDTTFSPTIRVDAGVQYAENFSILKKFLAASTKTTREPLLMDVYRPAATDTATKRPLALFLHTGNFFPQYATGPNGGVNDLSAVEICSRLAKMGYVSASVDYRTGWAPTLADESMKRYTLINASYRGVQDLNAAIRFFKKNSATYGVDTNKIVVFGQGTGAYISLAAATFNTNADSIKFDTTTYGPRKFYVGTNKMVQPWVNGDIDGKTQKIAPAGYWDGGILSSADTMCVPNHPAHTQNFHMQVNMGGALGDLNWIDAQTRVPMISFHVPYDLYAPYQNAVLFVNTPRGPEPVIRVQGADSIQRKMDRLGLNAKINATKIRAANNPYQSIFNTRNGGLVNGLFPLLGDTITDSSPWDFWTATNPKNADGLLTNPRMSAARARRYTDTIMTVFAPRACIVLNLPCASLVSSTEELLKENTTKLSISPNPASSLITFESEVYNPMQAIELFDMSGRSVKSVTKINNNQYTLDRGSLPAGMYIAKVKFEGGVLSKKIIFDK